MDGGDEQGALGGEKNRAQPDRPSQKRTKGSLLVEASGVPVGLCVAGANKNDFKLVAETLQSLPRPRPEPRAEAPPHLCLDKGDDFEEVRAAAAACDFKAHIRSRGEDSQTPARQPGQQARRWVVERTHRWMNRFCSVLTRWAKKAENYLGLLHFVCGLIAYRAAGLFG
jgi:putative transposase